MMKRMRVIGIIEDAIPRALLAVVATDLRPWHIGIADAGIRDGKDAAVLIARVNALRLEAGPKCRDVARRLAFVIGRLRKPSTYPGAKRQCRRGDRQHSVRAHWV